MDMESILRQYSFNLRYAKALVEDVSPAQMSEVPAKGLVNHAAWTMGHLVTGSALLAEDLGLDRDLPEGWDELFIRKGPGDPRLPLDTVYPAKQELVLELERQHARVVEAIGGLDEKALSEPFTWRFSADMPTLKDMIHFMCVNHEAMHLGQLAAWRRAMNAPSALATL